MKTVAPITQAYADVAHLEAQLDAARSGLRELVAYVSSSKFWGPGNGHVAVEDVILRVRELEAAMLWWENTSEFTGLCCTLDFPADRPHVASEDDAPSRTVRWYDWNGSYDFLRARQRERALRN